MYPGGFHQVFNILSCRLYAIRTSCILISVFYSIARTTDFQLPLIPVIIYDRYHPLRGPVIVIQGEGIIAVVDYVNTFQAKTGPLFQRTNR